MNYQNAIFKSPVESKKVYFAALNTGAGFQSRFEEIFSDVCHTVILKGGPGTGKSTLIRAVAAEAENRGLDVEYFLCSSDPKSLDGVLIGDSVLAVIDGTSPHCVDPKMPGVRDEIVNLGQFWSPSLLRCASGEIEYFLKKIKTLYGEVYELMRMSALAENLAEKTVLRYLDKEKMDAAAERLARLFKGDGQKTRYRGLSSLGTRGRVFLDSYEALSSEVCYFRDKYRVSHLFLDSLKSKLTLRGVGIDYSESPVFCRTDGIFARDLQVSFVAKEGEGDKIINMERFISRGISAEKSDLKYLRKASSEALSVAEKKLSEIGELHDSLEKIYIDAMDFREMNRQARRLLISLFKNQMT